MRYVGSQHSTSIFPITVNPFSLPSRQPPEIYGNRLTFTRPCSNSDPLPPFPSPHHPIAAQRSSALLSSGAYATTLVGKTRPAHSATFTYILIRRRRGLQCSQMALELVRVRVRGVRLDCAQFATRGFLYFNYDDIIRRVKFYE